ncbi:MAG: type II toxin-antitoxin system death-on-curing family toxin [Gammaproteobacteria bacterium]|nr:type II toxin-antitoxin system death-on-curing family toxin [Gammaproteobacteria bacterium]
MASRLTEPTWLARVVVDAIHIDQVREHGGRTGLRDEGGLESALARPRHKWLYDDDADLAALAAAYGFGLARNHPYVDGNKRVALVVMLTFLAVNGRSIEATDEDVLTTLLALAAGRLTESALADWLRSRLVGLG